MTKEYVIYKGKEKIVSGASPLEITEIAPNTEVQAGTYKVSAKGSQNFTDISAFKTLPIAVTGLEFSPKTSTADAGAAGNRQLTVTVKPEDATNKKVKYKITPEVKGLTVSEKGNIIWDENVPAGVYTTTGTTEDGKKTDSHTLTLNNPA
ncbi:hypothetical protein IGJ41_000305 [Enterococcus sp. DIV1537a]|uniref:phage tail protein n=1 Tax=Enterococcus sp. DIV1537a TaxID=2774733 RepID=UPI003F21E5F2